MFVDAKKDEWEAYLESVVPLLRPGGVLVVDNLLWGVQVPLAAVNEESPDKEVASLLAFNERFVNRPQLQSVILPFADGTGFAVKAE
ncbi:hypothetical protein Harman_39560 [Haloarcula mannanilytica]|uniref:O-methyltransferase n=1 Tax=Haloarcula mannanilytica TaxID=2509225 RepID=A0A4C2ENB6_9EURY|nr:hypothetical protein Harman_39560 [Haloarcula mannanilytica]